MAELVDAQRPERCTERRGGSNPLGLTLIAPVAQLDERLASNQEICAFESCQGRLHSCRGGGMVYAVDLKPTDFKSHMSSNLIPGTVLRM